MGVYMVLVSVSVILRLAWCCPEGCLCGNNTVTCTGGDYLIWSDVIGSLPQNIHSLGIMSLNLNMSLTDKGSPYYSLHSLNIYACRILNFEFDALKLIQNVMDISIEKTEWESELPMSFNSLSKLTSVSMRYNENLNIDKHTFEGLVSLKTLDLTFCELQILPSGVFSGLNSLSVLNVSHNKLSFINPDAFTGLPALHRLDLTHNSFMWLHKDVFDNVTKLQEIWLGFNPWACNCGTKWLIDKIKHSSSNIIDDGLIMCDSPYQLTGHRMVGLQPSELHCEEPTVSVTIFDPVIAYMHEAILVCNASGDPLPSVYWVTPHGVLAHPNQKKWISPDYQNAEHVVSYNGKPSFFNATIRALETGNLLLHNFRYKFAGEYTCVAENPAGIATDAVNVTITTSLKNHAIVSIIYGSALSGGALLFGIIFGALRLCLEYMCCKREKSELSANDISIYIDDDDDEEIGPPGTYPFSPFGFFWSPSESRQSPRKCVTPAEPQLAADKMKSDEDANKNTRETLEDVRALLRHGMARSVGRIRSGAQQVRQSSSRTLSTIRQNSSVRLRNIRSSTGQYVHRVRSSTGQYVHRVRSGVSIGMKHMQGNIQSIREMCGTGYLPETVSSISVVTDVDSNQTSQVVKTVTHL